MKGKELGKLLLDGLLFAEDGRLVVHDCAHVLLECIYILANEDLVLLGLIPIRIKSSSEVLHMVLQCNGRTDRVLLLRWLWWWRLGGERPSFSLGAYWDPKPRLIRSKPILIGGLISLVVHLLWPWCTRFVFLNHDRLDRVYPSLIIL